MPEKIHCSVPILSLNSKKTLEHFLPSLAPYVDDVFIMDGNSTDGTQEYARSLGVRVEKQFDHSEPNQPITDFFAMRMLLWSKAKYDWLFLLDADEEVTSEILEIVRRIVEENDPKTIHRFLRMARLPNGKLVQHAFFYPDYYPRVFHRGSGATLANRPMHERFVIPSDIKEIDYPIGIVSPWLEPLPFWHKLKHYLKTEAEYLEVKSFQDFIRWIVWYNIRSSLGQLGRAFRVWAVARWKWETVLPWSYTLMMIAYRWFMIPAGWRAWRRGGRKNI